MTSTFSKKFAFDLIGFAERMNGNADNLSDLTDMVERQADRINAHAISEIWTALHEISEDPFLAFHMSVEFAFSARRTPTLIMQSSGTVRESLQMGMEYSAIIANVLNMDLKETDETIYLDFAAKDDWKQTPRPVQIDCMCATLVSCLNSLQLCVGKFISPSILEIACDAPKNAADFFDIFNSSIVFGASRNRIGFPADISGLPIATKDNGLLKTLRQYGDELKREIVVGTQPEFVSHAKSVLLDVVSPHADLSIEAVASHMNMSARSLQRKLKEVDCSYKMLLDDTRASLAKRYLQAGDKSIDEIGYLLGYSETTSFARAFRRWCGKSPKQYRADIQ